MLLTILRAYRRFFWRSPLVTSLAGIVLAVGFTGSVLTYVVMTTVSPPKSNGLRSLSYSTIAEESGGGNSRAVSWLTYQQLQESAGWPNVTLVAYAEPIRAHVSYEQSGQEISVAATSSGFFSAFTEGLDAGRDFSFFHNGPHDPEIVVSRSLAEKLFVDPGSALDRQITLNGYSFRVIGVAPRSFSGLWSPTDAWVTPGRLLFLAFGAFQANVHRAGEKDSALAENSNAWQKIPFFYVLAGSPSLSLNALQERFEKVVRAPDSLSNHLHVSEGLSRNPVWDNKVRSWSRLAFLLSLALILAVTLNYCGLLLAQAPKRLEEVRLRRVLGAKVRNIILENMCGPVFTVLAGFSVAACSSVFGLWLLVKWVPYFLPFGGISAWVALSPLGMGLVIACTLAVVLGLVPALRLLRDSGTPHMGYTVTTGRKINLALNGIVSFQIASCIVMCLVAAMILSSVRSLTREALGFNGDRLTTIEIGPSSRSGHIEFSTASDTEFPLSRFSRLVVEISSNRASEVKYLSIASCAPLVAPMKTITIQRMDDASPPRSIHFCAVSRGFFQAMGNPILEGRGFSSDSFIGNLSEVVINRQLAKELWPAADPMLSTVRVEDPNWGLQFVAHVVGVAEDMRFSGLTSASDATIFLPLKGNVFTFSFPLYILAQGAESPRSIDELTEHQAAISMPSLGVTGSWQTADQLHESFVEQKVRVWLSGAGAALVAILAYLGLYGVLVHSVNSRRKEMALRASFGASAGSLRKIIIQQACYCGVVAIAISAVAWKPVMILAANSWLGTVELSWQVAFAIPLFCLAASAAISLVPASKVAKVPPTEILREQ